MPDASLWRLPAGQLLRSYAWAEETVLYNDLSGDTHLLAPEAMVLLRRLQDSPASSLALAAELAVWLGPESDGDNDIDDLLDRLQILYLIEPWS